MNNIRVKICGITSVEDALAATKAGADAIGLVFYAPSPRSVSLEQAREIAAAVGPFVTVVGLFVNEAAPVVREILANVNLHVLQFHGDESEEYCEQFERPYLKAIRMKPELNVEEVIAGFSTAVGVLLDAYKPGVPGGTGESFDWQRVPIQSAKPIVLAGGLTPENIALAVKATSVYGVDVSGGVELSPGKKDVLKVEQFIYNAKHA